jgi:hypothetical protein
LVTNSQSPTTVGMPPPGMAKAHLTFRRGRSATLRPGDFWKRRDCASTPTLAQSWAVAWIGGWVAHAVSTPRAAACAGPDRKATTAWRSASVRPAVIGFMIPTVSDSRTWPGGMAASAARLGARSTGGSWQDLQLVLNTCSPLALAWASASPGAAVRARPAASAAAIQSGTLMSAPLNSRSRPG